MQCFMIFNKYKTMPFVSISYVSNGSRQNDRERSQIDHYLLQTKGRVRRKSGENNHGFSPDQINSRGMF